MMTPRGGLSSRRCARLTLPHATAAASHATEFAGTAPVESPPRAPPRPTQVCQRLGEMIVALGGAVEEPRHGKSSAYRSDPPE